MKECVSAYGASALQFLYNYAVGQGAYGGLRPCPRKLKRFNPVK